MVNIIEKLIEKIIKERNSYKIYCRSCSYNSGVSSIREIDGGCENPECEEKNVIHSHLNLVRDKNINKE